MLVLPHNLEAEKSVLGAMLIDNQIISSIQQTIQPEDFSNQLHQRMCEVIYGLTAKNIEVDIVTVSGALPEVDIQYIMSLCDIATTQNAKSHCKIIAKNSLRRKFYKAGMDIQEMACNGNYETMVEFKNDVLQKVDIEIKGEKKQEAEAKQIIPIVLSEIERRYKSKQDNKLMYGISWVDKKTGGARPPDLTILAARPSVGKTGVALQFGINMAKKDNQVVIFNLEMGKEQLIERMLANEGCIDTEKIRYPKYMDDSEWAKLGRAQGIIAQLPIQIYDDLFKIEEIRAKCRELKNKGKLDYVIVDYLQLCDTSKKVSSVNERVSHLSRTFKLIAKELKVPICVLSQLSRANEHDKRPPKLIDLRDSGSIEQDADNVFFLHDPTYGQYEGEAKDIVDIDFIIAKQRNGDRDICNTVRFYKKTQKFV